MANLKNTTVNDTGYLQLPVGTTAQRPGSPVNGDMRFNSQFKVVEQYIDGAWKYMPPIVESGLVLHLDAAEPASYPGSGTAWTDLSGNGNDGTLLNGTTYSNNNGGVFTFDGVNDYINGVHNTQLDITGDITIECWFNVTNTRSDWVRVFGKGDSTNRTVGLWYNYSTSLFLYQRWGSTNMAALYNSEVSLDTWYHMAGTSSGNSHILYLNSIPVATSSLGTTFFSSTDPYKVGYGNISSYHIGEVSNCRIYDRPLSEAEIQQNFNALRGRYGI